MKAMLIWSDGTEINQSIYEDKDGVSGVDRAVHLQECTEALNIRTLTHLC